MENNIYIIVAICVFFSCGPKQEKVEKITEERVEIVCSTKGGML
jgi:hypothetical protein